MLFPAEENEIKKTTTLVESREEGFSDRGSTPLASTKCKRPPCGGLLHFCIMGSRTREGLSAKKEPGGFFLAKSGETGTAHHGVRSSSHRVQGIAAAPGDSPRLHQKKFRNLDTRLRLLSFCDTISL